MPKINRPRHGSLQFYPRKRARKVLPRVNWKAINQEEIKNMMGFIGYKVGMKSAIVKDLTPNSMTKEKKISTPCTIIEIPPMKILSVRFYKANKVLTEIINDNLDKELKRKLKLTKKKFDTKKEVEKKEKEIDNYDDIKLLVYSVIKKTGIKKTPDISEIGMNGTNNEKITFIKENLNKEISALEILKGAQIVDIRGLTKGKGFSGPVKRFGIDLKVHKTEKGIRRPGSLAPWHPARVTFRAPLAGQLGMLTRIIYNNKIIHLGRISDNDINPKNGFKKYGKIKTDYVILRGSVQGANKRALLITAPLRESKTQKKKKFEFISIE